MNIKFVSQFIISRTVDRIKGYELDNPLQSVSFCPTPTLFGGFLFPAA